jgi:hypothetical protein
MADENNQGATGDDWLQSIPEELRSASFIRPGEDGKPKPLAQVVADLNDAAQYMGNSLRIPGPDAGADDLRKFHDRVMEKIPGLMPTPNLEDPDSLNQTFAKLGRPEGADGYKAPDGITMDPEQLGQLKAIAHKANLTQKQFADYLANWSEADSGVREQAAAKHQEAVAALKGEWGAAYDERVGQINAFLKTNSATPQYVLEALEAGTLPAEQVRWLYAMADAVGNEDGQFFQQQGDTGAPLVAPDEAKARIAEITARLYDRSNPPTADEMNILDKKQEAYEHMARGRKPPPELMRYVS